jgi:UrcA family protein
MCRTSFAIAAAALLATTAMSTAPATAQSYYEDEDVVTRTTRTTTVTRTGEFGDDMIVTAPRAERRDLGRSSRGFPVQEIALSRRVSHANLDLKNARDYDELLLRIEETARDACRELDMRYPDNYFPPLTSDRECVRNAINDSMAQVRYIAAR